MRERPHGLAAHPFTGAKSSAQTGWLFIDQAAEAERLQLKWDLWT
jgi:hypothetical protein